MILAVLCLVIPLGQAYKNYCAVVLPEKVTYIRAEGVPDTKDKNMQEALAAHEEIETAKEVPQKKESEHEKVLAVADKAIADTQELINQYGSMKLQDAEKVRQEAVKENIIMADRGGYIGYKSNAKVPKYNLSDEEFKLMTQVIQAEAGGEPYEGQVAVANVIFNRVKAGWAGTVSEVINQKGQFTNKRKEPSVSVMDAVKEASYGRNAVTEGTLFFQNLNLSTDFTIPNTKEYVTKIGRHSFYR